MDTRLLSAAQTGNVNELRSLMTSEPLLFKPAELSGGQNPLHIACNGGHVEFVKELLLDNPDFAEELNEDGLTPLHIASVLGYVDIVKELLVEVGPHLCFVKAKNSKTALHYAVIKGQTRVIDELISFSLPSIKEETDRGETCFHMAVKHKRVEALEHLTRHVKWLSFYEAMCVLNRRNKQGNTILHMAASSRNQQDKVLGHLLLTIGRYLEFNTLNKRGLTPLDVFVSEEGGRKEMEERLIKAGAKRAAHLRTSWRRMFDRKNTIGEDMSIETRNTLLVVLALIMASTYQAVVSPPGGLWQDSVVLLTNNNTMPLYNRTRLNSTDVPHLAGASIFRTLDPVGFTFFFVFNTIGFMMSCALSLHLIAPNDLVIWLALVPMFVTYSISAGVVTTSRKAGIVITVCAVVLLFVATQKHFFAAIYGKISRIFSSGKNLYKVSLFKTKSSFSILGK